MESVWGRRAITIFPVISTMSLRTVRSSSTHRQSTVKADEPIGGGLRHAESVLNRRAGTVIAYVPNDYGNREAPRLASNNRVAPGAYRSFLPDIGLHRIEVSANQCRRARPLDCLEQVNQLRLHVHLTRFAPREAPRSPATEMFDSSPIT